MLLPSRDQRSPPTSLSGFPPVGFGATMAYVPAHHSYPAVRRYHLHFRTRSRASGHVLRSAESILSGLLFPASSASGDISGTFIKRTPAMLSSRPTCISKSWPFRISSVYSFLELTGRQSEGQKRFVADLVRSDGQYLWAGLRMIVKGTASSEQYDVQFRVGYTINLNLPETTSPEVFNAIFKSLKEHLLSE
jgi:hypothetical protein